MDDGLDELDGLGAALPAGGVDVWNSSRLPLRTIAATRSLGYFRVSVWLPIRTDITTSLSSTEISVPRDFAPEFSSTTSSARSEPASIACRSSRVPAAPSEAPAASPASTPSGNPFAGIEMYRAPWSNAENAQRAAEKTNAAEAALFGKIAAQPQASWFGGWSGDIATAVDNVDLQWRRRS